MAAPDGKVLDEQAMSAWIALMQAHSAVVDALAGPLEAELGLPLSWHEVLVWLAGSPDGRLRMQELARSVLLSKSGITRLIDRMHRAGLVRRENCSADRRVVYAVITDQGRDTLVRALPVFASSFRDAFGRHLDRDDTAMLGEILAKILSGLGERQTVCPTTYVHGAAAPHSEAAEPDVVPVA